MVKKKDVGSKKMFLGIEILKIIKREITKIAKKVENNLYKLETLKK